MSSYTVYVRPHGSLTRLLLLTVAAEIVVWVVWVVVVRLV